MAEGSSVSYEFGSFRLDQDGELCHEGGSITLRPQLLHLLQALVERAGRVCSHQELSDRIWPETRHRAAGSLSRCVWELRAALGEQGAGLIETVPKRGYRLVAEVTQVPHTRNPDRPATGETRTTAAGSRLRRRVLAAMVLTAVVTAAVTVAVVSGLGGGRATTSRVSVAIPPFVNLSDDADAQWLSVALAELLSFELSAADGLRTVPSETMGLAAQELGLAETAAYSVTTLGRLRQRVACDLVVAGAYLRNQDGAIDVTVRIQDSRNGETLLTEGGAAPEEELTTLVGTIAQALRQRLEMPGAATAGCRAAVPRLLIAQRLYAEGLQLQRAGEHLAAATVLSQAVAAEPSFPLSHAALSRTWSDLGYDRRAVAEATAAVERAATLPREKQLEVEARLAAAHNDWDLAATRYGALWEFYPDEIEYGLALCDAATRAGDLASVEATLTRLSGMAPVWAPDPRIDLCAARAARLDNSFRHQLQAAQRAADGAASIGARQLHADALVEQGRALASLGRWPEAVDRASAALQVYGDNRLGQINGRLLLGSLLAEHGELEAATGRLNEAATIARQIGSLGGEAVAAAKLAALEMHFGHTGTARTRLEQAATLLRQVGNRESLADTLYNLGILSRREGDLTTAADHLQQAEAVYRETGARAGQARTALARAGIEMCLGHLEAARVGYQEAADGFHATGATVWTGHAGVGLGDTCRALGDLPAAAAALAEAFTIAGATGDAQLAMSTRIAAARLALDRAECAAAAEHARTAFSLASAAGDTPRVQACQAMSAVIALECGDPATAAATAQDAAQRARELGYPSAVAPAQLTAATALLQQRRVAEAAELISSSQRLLAGSQDLLDRLHLEITDARLALAQDRVGDAITALNSAVVEATRAGHVPLRLAAGLALAGAECADGRGAAAGKRLQALATEATGLGFTAMGSQARRELELCPVFRTAHPGMGRER